MKTLSKERLFAPTLNSNHLKLIAITTMLIDHIGAFIVGPYLAHHYNAWPETLISFNSNDPVLFNVYLVLRLIGRIAFPIFCFLLVEGYSKTHSKVKYFFNLLVFALISVIPFNLAYHTESIKDAIIDGRNQNVLFTLALGLLAMAVYDIKAPDSIIKKLIVNTIKIVIIVNLLIIALICSVDYSSFGVLFILLLHIVKGSKKKETILIAFATCWEFTAPLAAIFTYKYNGLRGKKSKFIKYFFYAFYPAHLAIIAWFRICILKI